MIGVGVGSAGAVTFGFAGGIVLVTMTRGDITARFSDWAADWAAAAAKRTKPMQNFEVIKNRKNKTSGKAENHESAEEPHH
jgi:hypothetical protein